jgi:RNA polymerase sigma factor (sigma-70 family)
MKPDTARPLLRDIDTLFRGGAVGGLTDGELLGRFVASRDEAAFEVLVHRLGPMVLGVCRRMLHDRHDAEDAFQATFLVLAQRAPAIEPPDRLGPWLFGVARRVAMRANRDRRKSRVATMADPPERAVEAGAEADDLLRLLDRELGRLPEKYRAPIVLCHLEGKPYKEAARLLGWREGTLSGRLTRGRSLLAARLARLGVTTSAGSLAMVLTKEATASVPASWAVAAAGVACAIRGGGMPVVAAGAAALAKGTLRTMLMTRLRVASAALVAVGIVGVGAASGGRDDPAPRSARTAQERPASVPKTPAGTRVEFANDRGAGDLLFHGPGRYTDLGRAERVEAYKIGDDLFLNVAPPGSGRVLLEKVAPRSAEATKAGTALPKPAVDEADRIRTDLAFPLDRVVTERLDKDPLAGRDDGDAAFFRRMYLDLLGRAPTAEEIRKYVDSDEPDKAEALARRLLDDPAAIARIKASLILRIEATAPRARKPAPAPVTFTITGATLDRIHNPAGDLIDIRLENGPHDPRSHSAEKQTYTTVVDGRLVSTVSPLTTRLLGLPVAGDASIRVESGDGVVTSGKEMLGQLKLGMRLTLEIVSEGSMLSVRSITARPAPPPAAESSDSIRLYDLLKQAEPPHRR